MSTRSDIIVHCTDNKWRRVYCHWDGYLEHNGRILFDHYTDRVLATDLVMPGDMSSLGAKGGKRTKWSDTEGPYYTRFTEGPHQYEMLPQFKGITLYYAGRQDQTVEQNGRLEKLTGKALIDAHKPIVGDSLFDVWPPEDTWTEYTYVFADHHDGRGFTWWVGDPDEGSQTLVDLGEALQGKRTIRSNIKMFGGIVLGKHGSVDPTLDTRDEANR
jgi:hypothetical protein